MWLMMLLCCLCMFMPYLPLLMTWWTTAVPVVQAPLPAAPWPDTQRTQRTETNREVSGQAAEAQDDGKQQGSSSGKTTSACQRAGEVFLPWKWPSDWLSLSGPTHLLCIFLRLSPLCLQLLLQPRYRPITLCLVLLSLGGHGRGQDARRPFMMLQARWVVNRWLPWGLQGDSKVMQ